MKVWQKIFIACFAGLILFPSAIDLAHVFSGHKHDYCNHYAKAHFHQKNIDCELFDFQQKSFSFPPLFSWSAVEEKITHLPASQAYTFLNTFKKLHFSLRAPPALT